MHPHERRHEGPDAKQPPRGYCVACKSTRDISAPRQIERAGGPAIEGVCAACGSKMFVLGGSLSPEP